MKTNPQNSIGNYYGPYSIGLRLWGFRVGFKGAGVQGSFTIIGLMACGSGIRLARRCQEEEESSRRLLGFWGHGFRAWPFRVEACD